MVDYCGMNETIDVNPIPYLTWTWMKINKDSVDYDFSLTENNGREIQVPEGVTVTSGKAVKTELSEPQFAIGEQAAKFISDCASIGRIYTFERSKTDAEIKPLIIRISADENSATHQIIHAKAHKRQFNSFTRR